MISYQEIKADEFKKNRILLEASSLTCNDSLANQKVPLSIIMSHFQNITTAYQEKNIELIMNSLQNLSEISALQSIDLFQEFVQFNVSKIFLSLLLINNSQLHSITVSFFNNLFKYDRPPLLQIFLDNGLLPSLLNGIFQFPDSNLETFQVIYRISQRSDDVVHKLLDEKFLYFLLLIFRQDNQTLEARYKVSKFLSVFAKNVQSIREMNNMQILLRNIISDHSLSFIWAKAFSALNLMITDKQSAEFFLIHNEYHKECNEILSCSNDLKLIKSVINVVSSFFNYSPNFIEFNFEKIVFILTNESNEKLAFASLDAISNIIFRGYLARLADYNLFAVLKCLRENGNFAIKKKTIYIMGKIIRSLSSSQIHQLIPYNFMFDFVQMLDTQDPNFFNFLIGIITKLLQTNPPVDQPFVFWEQFDQAGGLDILIEIINNGETEFSTRASRFIDIIYKRHPCK